MDPLEQLLSDLPSSLPLTLSKDEREEIRTSLSAFIADTQTEEIAALADGGSILVLHKEEKLALRKEMVRFIAERQVFEEEERPLSKAGHWLSEGLPLLWQGILPRTMVLACMVLLLSSGVAFASESALPGDYLYTVKVKVVEPFQKNLLAEEVRPEWDAHLALRRLEEAEMLAERGKLQEDVLSALAQSSLQYLESASSTSEESGRGNSSAAEPIERVRVVHMQKLQKLQTVVGRGHSSISDTVPLQQKDSGHVPPGHAPARGKRIENQAMAEDQARAQSSSQVSESSRESSSASISNREVKKEEEGVTAQDSVDEAGVLPGQHGRENALEKKEAKVEHTTDTLLEAVPGKKKGKLMP